MMVFVIIGPCLEGEGYTLGIPLNDLPLLPSLCNLRLPFASGWFNVEQG